MDDNDIKNNSKEMELRRQNPEVAECQVNDSWNRSPASALTPDSPQESQQSRTKKDHADDQGQQRGHEHAGSGQVFRIPGQRVPLRLKQVYHSLERRIERFSTEDQGDGHDQNQPLNRRQPEIAGQTDRSEAGYQMDPEIPLSLAE
jgi:hypothetical protein